MAFHPGPARVLCALLIATFLHGCGGTHGGGSTFVVNLVGGKDCNNCGAAGASALKFRMFLVSDSTGIRTSLNKGLPWNKHVSDAGSVVVGTPMEDFINPNSTKPLQVLKDPKAKALVVEGNFCKRVGADWYVLVPLKTKGPFTVTASATSFAVTNRK